MTMFLLSAFVLECLVILTWGLMRRNRMIQYPFLAAAVFLGWMLPQFMGLRQFPFLPPGSLDKTILMTILCLGAAYWGYVGNTRVARLFWWDFNKRRLRLGSAVLSLAGAFFFFQVSLLAAEVTAQYGGAWTGIITIYVFFARLLTVGMVIALILHLRQPSWLTWGVILFDLAFYLDRIIIKGRRAAMVELTLITLMALWFNRRWLPQRWAMITVMVIGSLVINSIGEYRKTMLGDDQTTWSGAGLKEILEIDYTGNLKDLASGDIQSHDLLNAAMDIDATDHLLKFDFGLSHWNRFVETIVPGQWVGHDVKHSLMIDFDDVAYRQFSHDPYSGSTHTGLSDSFLSFWYFGAVKFFLIGLIMSRWYGAAVRGNIVAQMILMLVINDSLQAITHSTQPFFNVFIVLVVFLLPVLMYARRKPANRLAIVQSKIKANKLLKKARFEKNRSSCRLIQII